MGDRPQETELETEHFGPITVLYGVRRGKYPHGNTLLVEGERESLLIDPSLGLVPRRDALPRADRVLFSHCHEDHIAGAHLYPALPWHFHEADLPGIQSLDGMMDIYGYPSEIADPFRKAVVEQFHFMEKPDALAYRDGDVFDLGGVTVRVVHSPGHTRGHSCLLVEWEGDESPLLYLGDIDLSSFGPYYGDAWSNLGDFERSLERVRDIEARWYATFHHIGVLEREAFLERLERYAAVIGSREERLFEYLAEPHDLAEIADHRFVYRPGDAVGFAYAVERRSMAQHIERLLDAGCIEESSPGRWVQRDS